MTRTYHYTGVAEHARLDGELPPREAVTGPDAVRRWVRGVYASGPTPFTITATFAVTETGELWIADRHSEHVQCARGEPVLSAGEITFEIDRSGVSVSQVTNQSTGYCPEPESWPAVAAALDRAGLAHPGYWTTAFLFRRCPACGMTNIVKDNWFECGVCDTELPVVYNFGI